MISLEIHCIYGTIASMACSLYLPKLFLGTDSCAGIGATGKSHFFHGNLFKVNYVIEGMRVGEEALFRSQHPASPMPSPTSNNLVRNVF
jgi:hypothetical protein